MIMKIPYSYVRTVADGKSCFWEKTQASCGFSSAVLTTVTMSGMRFTQWKCEMLQDWTGSKLNIFLAEDLGKVDEFH